MDVSMSQMGYMYSQAVSKYGGGFNVYETGNGSPVAVAKLTGESSLQGVGQFLYRSNYEMDAAERQAQMSAYSSYLYNMLEIGTESSDSTDEDVLPISSSNEISKDPASLICGESIISDFTYGNHGREYLFSYDEKGMSCLALFSGEEMWSMEFTDESQYEQVKEFLSEFDPEDNLTFTSNDLFWNRFLNGNIDVDDFKYTLDKYVKNGKVDYYYTDDEGVLHHDSNQMMKYLNIFGDPDNPFKRLRAFPSYQALMLDRQVSREYSLKPFFGDHESYLDYFYSSNPDMKGEKAFWNWKNQEWATIEEMLDIWDEADKDKPHYNDKKEQRVEEYYEKNPENRGKALFTIGGDPKNPDPHFGTYEEWVDWNEMLNGKSGAINIKNFLEMLR